MTTFPRVAAHGYTRNREVYRWFRLPETLSTHLRVGSRESAAIQPTELVVSIVMKTISHYLWFLQQLGKTPAARKVRNPGAELSLTSRNRMNTVCVYHNDYIGLIGVGSLTSWFK